VKELLRRGAKRVIVGGVRDLWPNGGVWGQPTGGAVDLQIRSEDDRDQRRGVIAVAVVIVVGVAIIVS
jgi:hypothetical protein